MRKENEPGRTEPRRIGEQAAAVAGAEYGRQRGSQQGRVSVRGVATHC